MKLDDIMLSEVSQSQKDKTAGFHSYEAPGVVKIIKTESRRVVSGLGAGESYGSMGTVSVYKMKGYGHECT